MPRRLRDDLGREIYFGPAPRRVVSLVPSETYNLFALGLGDRVIGRTRFCVEPADAVGRIPVVGGTKDFDVDKVMALEPDLVLANKEENSRPALEKLATERFRVFVSFPRRVADAVSHLARLALLFEVQEESADLIRGGYQMAPADATSEPISVFVPVWRDPWMTFSAGTYADDVLAMSGFANVFAGRRRLHPLKADLGRAEPLCADAVGDRDTRYPRVTIDEIASKRPDAILLPDEPYAFEAQHTSLFREVLAGAEGRAELVSGKDLFWHGAWTVSAIPRLRALAERLIQMR